ncbi:MAG: hypothetical protein RDU30_00915 [Desulfovibrionaceae bacterium]|nr:hypothetical protein [Desulfovibrionaceae bacterium]
MIPCTIFTSTNPSRLSKGFSLGAEGNLVKKTGGTMVEGVALTVRFENITRFAEMLPALRPDQALAFGVCGHDKARVVSQEKLQKIPAGDVPVVARTREAFAYPAGPAILMIDYDPRKDGTLPLSDDALLATLFEVCPALRDAPLVLTHSASSHIFNGDTELVGLKGRRIYALVAEGQDVPRAGAALFRRLQLAGFGHIEIGKAGQLLERGIVDASVWQPERLDFAAGAACEPPLDQRRPAPRVINADAAPMDTRTALPDLSAGEEATRRKIVGDARAAMRGEADAIRAEWVETQVVRVLAKNGKNPDSAPKDAQKLRETYKNAAKYHDLFAPFELLASDGKPVTVGEILAEPDRWHGRRFRDPLEPDYGNDGRIAVLNTTAKPPYIFSHAHGGLRYVLRRERVAHVIQRGERLGAAESALRAMREDGGLFERNGEIVRVMDDGTVIPLSLGGVLVELDRAVRWMMPGRKGEATPCDCPRPIAEAVLAMRGRWNLPVLRAVATAPLYIPSEDRVLDTDGHDAGTGILLVCKGLDGWPGVPENPTADHIRKAVVTLWKPFVEFPFLTDTDRGVFVSQVLTAMVRPVLPTAPGFANVASTPGSGKTNLAKCAAVLAGAGDGAVMPAADTDEEMRKRLLAAGRRGAPVVILDNLTGQIASDALCAWLTSETLTDRILGKSEETTVTTSGVVILTGNNLVLKGDLCRRVLTCRIEPGVEAPWKRAFGLDPQAHCRDNRLAMVAAGLTILRWAMRRPRAFPDRLASFEHWSDSVRHAVVELGREGFLSVADPVGSIDEAFAADPETNKLSALLVTWQAAFGDRPVKVGEAIKRAGDDDALAEALAEIAGERGVVNDRRLGRWIERNSRRLIMGRRIEPAGKSGGSTRWVVKQGVCGDYVGFVSSPYAQEKVKDIICEGTKRNPQLPPKPPVGSHAPVPPARDLKVVRI